MNKMPQFYVIFAGKYFFPHFGGKFALPWCPHLLSIYTTTHFPFWKLTGKTGDKSHCSQYSQLDTDVVMRGCMSV